MVESRLIGAALAITAAALLAGCNGKPEDTGTASDAPVSTAPPPAYPSWAGSMIGRPLSEVAKGSTTCKGKIDLVTAKHTGVRKGSEVQGWVWDEGGAKPFDKIVFTTPAGVIIGAAGGGLPRPDVPTAVAEVKTPNVGWKGVVGAIDGPFRAVGLSAGDASCQFDSSAL